MKTLERGCVCVLFFHFFFNEVVKENFLILAQRNLANRGRGHLCVSFNKYISFEILEAYVANRQIIRWASKPSKLLSNESQQREKWRDESHKVFNISNGERISTLFFFSGIGFSFRIFRWN